MPLAVVAAVLLLVAGTARAATISVHNVRISQDTFPAHSEPDVAENPVNPNNLVAGSKFFTNPAKYEFKIGTYDSMDGGRTWHDDGVLPGYDRFYHTSDISFAFGPNGKTVYACVLGDSKDSTFSGIYVSRSHDGGKTWSSPSTVFEDPTGATFSDKPWITVDSSQGPRRGTVYVVWNLDDTEGSAGSDPDQIQHKLRVTADSSTAETGVVAARSTDFARTWSAPVPIRKFEPQNGHFALGAMPSVAPDGHLFVAYQAFDDTRQNGRPVTIARMDVAESSNGGRSFVERKAVGQIDPLPTELPHGTFRNYSMPAFQVSPRDGSMVLAWADMRNHDADILEVHSRDGKHWSKPVRVNDDPLHDGADQFQPALAVAPNGTYTCAWFDRRYDPNDRLIDEEIAQSRNDGKRFGTNIRVTTRSWDPAIGAPQTDGKETFIGDYQGLVADNLHVHPVWNDTQNGTSQQIRSAVISVRLFALK